MENKGKNTEHRLITFLLAEICDFSQFIREEDQKKNLRIAEICYEHINAVVVKNGGVIHSYIKGSAMCLFGFPVIYEDAPERAVKAAMELLARAPSLNEAIFKQTGIKPEFKMHMGVHSGLAVVTEIETQERTEFQVDGETLDIGTYLKNAAPANKILVSEQIYKSTKYLVEYEREGGVSVVEGDLQIKAYEPLRLKERPEAKRGIRGLYSPLVGRAAELDTIKSQIRDLSEGKAGVVFVTGEAGIGKSRIWQEARDSIEEEESKIWILEGQCLYHGEHLSYWPLLQILEEIYSITDKDTQELIREKISEATRKLLPDSWEDVVPYIAHLFSLELSGDLLEKVKYLSPRDLQIKILGSIMALLEAISDKIPLLLLIEDYHWIDSASLDFIKFMFGSDVSPSASRIMLFCMTREMKDKESHAVKEEMRKVWGDRFTEIKLKPLDNYSSLELTYNLLEIPGFPDTFKRKVLSKAEGNPFFLEEIIKSLIDSGALIFEDGMWNLGKKVEEIEIPETIQLVIAARLDRLGESLRDVLQMASVIGRTFYKSILSEIHEDREHLKKYLATLEEFEFILELMSAASSPEDSEYMFKHPLIQQVTYSTLIESRRKKLHRIVAGAMVELYKDRIEDFVGLVAQQYAASDDYDSAVLWLQKAGKKAKAAYANEDALGYYRAIIRIADQGFCKNLNALTAAYESMGDVYKTLGKNDDSIENYTRILEITDDVLIHARIIRKIGDTYQKQSMYSQALGHLHQSKAKLDELDEAGLGDAEKEKFHQEMQTVYHHIAWISYLIGDFSLALEYTDRALVEASLLKNASERNLSTASIYNIIAAVKTRTGQMEESYQYYQKSEKIFTEEDDLSGLGTVYNNCVNYFHEKGDFIRCIEYLEKSLDIATKTGSALSEAISSFNLGAEYLGLGKYDLARLYFDRYQKLNKLINNKLGQGWANESYARLYWEEDDQDRAFESIDTAIRIFGQVQSKIKEMGAMLVKADFLIDIERFDEASALLADVEEYALKNSLSDYLISIDIARGELLLKKKLPGEALSEFRKAEKKVSETDSLSALREIYFRMGQAMEKIGDKKYHEYFSLAKKMLTETAENIADNDLRHSFLARPFNKEILDAP